MCLSRKPGQAVGWGAGRTTGSHGEPPTLPATAMLCPRVAVINYTHTINWKILKEMGIPDHLTHLLRNLYAGQEATVRTGHGTTD